MFEQVAVGESAREDSSKSIDIERWWMRSLVKVKQLKSSFHRDVELKSGYKVYWKKFFERWDEVDCKEKRIGPSGWIAGRCKKAVKFEVFEQEV